MFRCWMIALVVLCMSTVSWAATVVLNNNPVAVPVVEANGKAYVDIVALMKLLGGQARYDAATHKVIITSANQQAAGGGGATGTSEVAGENGKLGTVYTLVKSDPLYFSLKNAEYTMDQVKIGEYIYAPKKDEKLLLLTFTVQNPQKKDLFVRWDSLKIQAHDAQNVTHESELFWGDTQSRQAVEITLKPAQTIEAYAVIPVPAQGEMYKLMVQPPTDNNDPVLRYNLRGLVKPLSAPFADPADKTGATALERVSAQVNTIYPLANFDVAVEKYEYTTNALDEEAPEEGSRFFVITLRVKNESLSNELLRADTFESVLSGADGEEFQYGQMLLASQNRIMDQQLKPGQEIRTRVYFTVPKDATPKTFAISEGESHIFEYAIK